jgi:hypothetical protein
MSMLHTALIWIHMVVTLVTLVVCLLHVGSSVWARVLAAGFGLQLLVSVFYQVMNVMVTRGLSSSFDVAGALYVLASLLGIVASVIIIFGLAGLFAQLGGMMARQGGERSRSAEPLDPA